jgi:GAF domain-containing protein
MLQVQRVKGYRYSQGQLIPLEGESTREASGARQSRLDLAELTLPIRVRGRVIGTIKAHKPPGAGEWLPDEIALAETLAEQLSTALESARLHEEAQQRATHEQTLSDMSAQLSRSLDMDTVLQTAVRELGQLLQLDEVSIHTAPPDDSASGETVDAR